MSHPTGQFVWHELMTTDPVAAGAYYAKVFGWTEKDAGFPGMTYTELSAGGFPLGGIMELPAHLKELGVRPHWGGYIAVDDVDGYTAKVAAAGGAIHKAPDDIPNVGRFSVVADPAGAHFMLFKSSQRNEPKRPPMGTPGLIDWNELYGAAPDDSFAFYAGLFGWTKAEAIDMGPEMGIYQIFHINGVPSGGMMKKPPQALMPAWLYYTFVDDIDAAQARAVDAGGQSLFGPSEVPGGMWIVQALDPQGALFAMVGPRKT